MWTKLVERHSFAPARYVAAGGAALEPARAGAPAWLRRALRGAARTLWRLARPPAPRAVKPVEWTCERGALYRDGELVGWLPVLRL